MRKHKYLTIALILVLVIALVGLSYNVSARPLAAVFSPLLGRADSFAVLAGTPNITSAAYASTITGDVGLDPATGFGIDVRCSELTGTSKIYDNNGAYLGAGGSTSCLTTDATFIGGAKTDLGTAYDNLIAGDNAPCTNGVPYTGPYDLGGKSLGPGVYCVDAGGFSLTGILHLTGSGIWIFRSPTTIITSTGSSVVVDDLTGNNLCNVWWRAATSVTLNTTTSFIGNILALDSIQMLNKASLIGRALARNGNVTLDTNTITIPICAAAATSTRTPTLTQTQTSTRTPTSTRTSTSTRTPTSTRAPTNTRVPTGTPVSSGQSNTSVPISRVLPGTGFAANRITTLAQQSTAYATLGDLWLEIPRLGVQMAIVGVPQQAAGGWDVSWLGNDAGWLNGTAFPTWSGNSVLTGHVYNADGNPGPFVHLNGLWWGDQVIVHAWGAQYVYEVRSVLQVAPGQVSSVITHKTQPWVTLITCRGYDAASNSYNYRVAVQAVLVVVK